MFGYGGIGKQTQHPVHYKAYLSTINFLAQNYPAWNSTHAQYNQDELLLSSHSQYQGESGAFALNGCGPVGVVHGVISARASQNSRIELAANIPMKRLVQCLDGIKTTSLKRASDCPNTKVVKSPKLWLGCGKKNFFSLGF